MKTTTVRFDHACWGEIERHCATRGIAHAAFIRDAVIERLARLDHVDRLAVLEARLDDHARWLAAAARTLTRIAARIGLVDQPPGPGSPASSGSVR